MMVGSYSHLMVTVNLTQWPPFFVDQSLTLLFIKFKANSLPIAFPHMQTRPKYSCIPSTTTLCIAQWGLTEIWLCLIGIVGVRECFNKTFLYEVSKVCFQTLNT